MSLEACATLVQQGDPDRFLAAMTAPPRLRARLFALYAFNLEVARGPWVSAEPMIGQMRLQFWRDTLEEIGQGGAVRGHEVAGPLAEMLRETAVEPGLLDAMVMARWADLERAPMAQAERLQGYLSETAGNLMWASVQALGGGAELAAPARAVGLAQGLAGWLMAVPELEARGWQAVPDDVDGLIDTALAGLADARRARFGAAKAAARASWRASGVLKRAKSEPGLIRGGGLGGAEFARRGSLLAKSLTGRW